MYYSWQTCPQPGVRRAPAVVEAAHVCWRHTRAVQCFESLTELGTLLELLLRAVWGGPSHVADGARLPCRWHHDNGRQMVFGV